MKDCLSYREFGRILFDRFQEGFARKNDQRQIKPYVFCIIGPPCIGKTLIQNSLDELLPISNVCIFQSSSCIKERIYRRDNLIGECSAAAYDLSKLKQLLCDLLSGQDIVVKKYIHSNGKYSDESYSISPKDIIYLDGLAWSYLFDVFVPDCVVLLLPRDMEQWRLAYHYRNIRHRHYSKQLAEEMFNLLMNSWDEFISRLSNNISLYNINLISATVIFKGKKYEPYYVIN